METAAGGATLMLDVPLIFKEKNEKTSAAVAQTAGTLDVFIAGTRRWKVDSGRSL